MKERKGIRFLSIIIVVIVLCGSIMTGDAKAAIPETINYQGYLTDNSGNPINATVSMTFRIYTVASGGTAQWTEPQSNVPVNNGIYNVVLGSVAPMGELPFDVPYFLGVTVGSIDSEMTPRQPLTSVAYAFTADTALSVASNVITSAGIQDGTVSSADVNFNYAGSTSKGGPATGLACTACVSQTELDFTPLLTETDPQVGTLTNGKWCMSNGTLITCTQDPPALANHNHDAAYVNVAGDTMTGALSVGGNISTDGVYRLGGYTVLSTPEYNTFIGRQAGVSNTSGDHNTFIGRYAGLYNDSGNSNIFVGYSAGFSNISGVSNTFVGMSAGQNSTSSSNTFLGRSAGYTNDTGESLTFVGRDAGYHNTTGNYNTVVGGFAGFSNSSGSYNVFIGYRAGYNEAGSNKLYIDSSDTSLPLIYGDFAANSVTINGSFSATGAKSFLQPHAKDPSKEIVYVATEAPEAVVMYRGTGELKDGRAVIELPDYFSVVAAEEGLQVQVTPTEDCNGIFVKSKNRDRIEIKELMNGKGKAKFDYLITAVRAGYEDHKPVVANSSFRPKENETAHAFAERYAGDDMNTKAIRAMLISNGILSANGELNMKLVKELGWTVKETELAKFEQ